MNLKSSNPSHQFFGANLEPYFRDAAKNSLMSADEEIEVARALEEIELSIWRDMLATDFVTTFLQKKITEVIEEDSSLAAEGKTILRGLSRGNFSRVLRPLRHFDQDRRLMKGLLHQSENSAFTWPTKFQFVLRRLQTQLAAADRLRERFVTANLRLVVSVARRFFHVQMPVADMIQEGNLGLMRAVERFDYRKGFRFSTYATWWIRHAIGRSIADRSRTIRLPVHLLETKQRFTQAARRLAAELGREPTTEEVARKLKISKKKLAQVSNESFGVVVSLDRVVADDDRRTLGDFAFVESAADCLSHLVLVSEIANLREILADLKPIELEVVARRFGLFGYEEQTLKEIGFAKELSRERIRQIEELALKKLRTGMANLENDLEEIESEELLAD